MRLRRAAGALGAVGAAIAVIACHATQGLAALAYDITLGGGMQLNDNLHLDPPTPSPQGEEVRRPVHETISSINPGLWVEWSAERDRLHLRYTGEYLMFEGDEALDSFWAHRIAADLNWRRWEPFFLEVGEDRSRVPRTQEREDEAFVDQIDRNQLSFRTGLSWEAGPRSTVELAYRGELDSYSSSGSTASREAQPDPGGEAFDRVERHFGEALVRHRWNALWGGEVHLAYGHVGRELAPEYTELNVLAAVEQRWSEHLMLRYRLEWRREKDGEPVTDEAAGAGASTGTSTGEASERPGETGRNNLLLGLEIRGDLGPGDSWTLAYQDSQVDQPDGDTLGIGRASATLAVRARLGSTVDVGAWHETRDFRISGREETAWGPTLGARWLITPTVALDLAGCWTTTAVREVGEDRVEDHTTGVSAGFVILVYKRVQLDAGYAYRENASSDSLRDHTNNIFFALLTFHLAPVTSGQLPLSYASGLVAGRTSPGGASAAGGGNAVRSVR
jgi:hypothetical protein